MGRPPCCDKVGIKKGPWTPEEDIILVSHIQEHGPGNWRSVPTNTGLLRCSKSCRLRWTNYLRPGIKRGNFTAHEEGMIIHLQALLGNKWAAIASYLPQRTDNDIKNYWNTHLKKKLKKFQSALAPMSQDSTTNPTSQFVSKSFSDRKSSLDFTANSSSLCKLNQTTSSTYASSTENISRLLEGWMRSSPKSNNGSIALKETWNQNKTNNLESHDEISICNNSMPSVSGYKQKSEQDEGGNNDLISHEEFESILSFENLNGASWEKSTTCESATTTKGTTSDDKENNNNNNNNTIDNNVITLMTEKKQKSDNNGNPPLTFLEKWLLEESTTPEVEEVMELSPIF